MADFSALKTSIQNYIKQNGNEEITGNLLQQILLSMVTTLGDSAINDLVTALNAEIANRGNADTTLQGNINSEATTRANADTELGGRITTLQGVVNGIVANVENGYVYAGIAIPSTTPATGKVFYLALTAGTYTNFGSTVVPQGINILKYNGSAWVLDSFLGLDNVPTQGSNNFVKSGGVLDSIIKDGSAFDLSAYNSGATYAGLSAALSALNALPAAYKRGGMSIKFVQTSDNKYVQYRLMATSFSTTETDWQGVDEEPVAGSENLVKSGGVYKKTSFISSNESDTYDEKVIIGKSKEDATIKIEHQKVGVVGSLKKNNHEVVTENQLEDYYTAEEVDEKIPFEETAGEDYTERIIFGVSKSDATMIVDKDKVRVKALETLEGKTFIVANPKELLRQNQWEGMTFAGYGDSITAAFGWGDTIRDFFKFSSKLNRGIGGTSVRNYNKDSMVSVFPTGTQNRAEWEASPYYDPEAQMVSCCQAMSSWSRIKASFPAEIKEDVRLVVIMGGTNDFGDSPQDIGDNLLPQWSDTDSNCLYDTEWISDSTYNPEAGDFNTRTSFKGAIASLIVKMQRWMPKARLVLASQLSGRGVSGENATNFMFDNNGHSPLDYAYATKKVADMMSIPYIPLFESVGINQFNRKDFIADEVHPYGVNYLSARNGQSQIARVMIGSLKNIFPFSITYQDELNN